MKDDVYVLGGSVSYASNYASGQEIATQIITSFSDDFLYRAFLEKRGISIINQAAISTTIFQNVYIAGDRWQYIRARAEDLSNDLIHNQCQDSQVVLLCPIADEIDPSIITELNNPIIGATIQGWLRQWDEEGKVTAKPMNWEALSKADFVFLSYEDISQQQNIVEKLKSLGNTIVITNDQMGADIYSKGHIYNLPSWPTSVIDPTGAGDTFATAFLIEYIKSGDLKTSAIMGHCAASLVIESNNMVVDALSDRMNQRYNEYLNKFKAEL